MSYILKDTSQGVISVKLTDAGRKKLSQGKLNIELFQLGDSEYCYDCYSTLPGKSSGINIIQSKYNAQNLNPIPEKNKAHVKYPIPMTQTSTDQTFGAAQAAHTYENIFNRASQRGFYSGNTGTTCAFSAFTGSAYTLNANFFYAVSAMTGGSQIELLSANTFQNQAFSGGPGSIPGYTPIIGDVLGITYHFHSGSTGTTDCYNVPCTASSAMLYYQITGGNKLSGRTGSAWSGSTVKPLYYSVDRALPDFGSFSANSIINIKNYTGATGARVGACVKVFPSVTGGTYSANSTNPMLTWYGATSPIPYWSPGSLSFENNCDVSVKDVKVWNMNINWTEQVAGVLDSTIGEGFETYDFYGSSGYCGTKEYLGYKSNNGQVDSGYVTDSLYTSEQSSSWYYNSYKQIKTVTPKRQKAIAVLHYTNQTISNFYGEKFAMQTNAVSAPDIGMSKNFRICMPNLMWHKKYVGTQQTACAGATEYGQCFYVDPPGFSKFPAQPFIMESSVNDNMNDDGLRYYYLYDDNAGPLVTTLGSTTVGPNPVGKVFPDLQLITIHDEELISAMTYKSNRSWTLPAPRVSKVPAGTGCDSGLQSSLGVFQNPAVEESVYLTYLMESNSGLTTGLHCSYYTEVKNEIYSQNVDLKVEFGEEFPYLRPFDLTGLDNMSGGTGWHANKIHLLYQVVQPGDDPSPNLWKKVNVTEQVGGAASEFTQSNQIPFSGCQLTSGSTQFHLTAANIATGTTYSLNDYITIPSASTTSSSSVLTGPQLLQFGDEYFFNGVLQTDIMATIYEMKYNINVSSTQFGGGVVGQKNSLNPTYENYYLNNGVYPNNIYMTEVGLFDNEDGNPDLMAIAKFQSPHKRQGSEQFVLKLDF